MGKETLIFILIVVVAFIILLTLLKSLLKAGIVIVIFIVLFRIGWVYTSDDLKEKFHLDTFINEKYSDTFFKKYDEFTEKRKESEIIDTDEINNTIDKQLEKLDEKVNEYINKEKKGSENE